MINFLFLITGFNSRFLTLGIFSLILNLYSFFGKKYLLCLKIFIVIFLCGVTSSCFSTVSNSSSVANEEFREKFSSEISAINSKRNELEIEEENFVNRNLVQMKTSNIYDDPALSLGVASPISRSGGYIDTSKISIKKYEDNFPSKQDLDGMISNFSQRSLPADMFNISYNTSQHPPFFQYGGDFDKIEIPKYDAYQISTNLDDKPYFIVSSDSLQKNIDKIIKSRREEDVEFSEILIKENKNLRRQKRLGEIFSSDKFAKNNSEQINKSLNNESEEKVIVKKDEDPFKNIIAAQIVQQNFKSPVLTINPAQADLSNQNIDNEKNKNKL